MRILYLEPFDGGAHRAFTSVLTRGVAADWTVLTLPGRHWKWRMRGAAAWLATRHREALEARYDLVVASSYLALAELVGLVCALSEVPKLLYFHENQLAYPVRQVQERDDHFGFTQLVSALAADRVAFNSQYNRDSFLEGGAELLERMPDAIPPGWIDSIRERSVVLPVPLAVPAVEPEDTPPGVERAAGPVVLWNHRWEHDKQPEVFFAALDRLARRGVPFRLAVCGERYGTAPAVFAAARERHVARIVHWGHLPDREEYLKVVGGAHLVVSTAAQEFFGVAVHEATHLGARPVVPDRLAYREAFAPEERYGTDDDLVEILEDLCRRWTDGAIDLRQPRPSPFRAELVLPGYQELFSELVRSPSRKD